MRNLVLVFTLFFLANGAAKDAPAKFEPNQEWSYRTRDKDPGSTLVIGAIENHPKLGRIIHITVRNVDIRSPRFPGGVMNQLGHLPMSETALSASVTKLLGSVAPPKSVGEGMRQWREAQGGVFTVSVAEAVDFAERALVGAQPQLR